MSKCIIQIGRDIEIAVKVVPGASRSKVVGLLGDALKVQIAAPPEGGKANAALQELIAAALGVRSRDVVVTTGLTSARKRLRVRGITAEGAAKKLGLG